MKQPKKVLACVDQSPYADYVADYSAWAAKKFDLPLELLHIIDRHQETAPVTMTAAPLALMLRRIC